MKPNQTGERFAKIVIAELADMHALLMEISEYCRAARAVATGETLEQIRVHLEAKRKARGSYFADDLLRRLGLENPEKDASESPPTDKRE